MKSLLFLLWICLSIFLDKSRDKWHRLTPVYHYPTSSLRKDIEYNLCFPRTLGLIPPLNILPLTKLFFPRKNSPSFQPPYNIQIKMEIRVETWKFIFTRYTLIFMANLLLSPFMCYFQPSILASLLGKLYFFSRNLYTTGTVERPKILINKVTSFFQVFKLLLQLGISSHYWTIRLDFKSPLCLLLHSKCPLHK